MLGQLLGTIHHTVAEAGGIIVGHGAGIAGSVFIYQPHTSYWIAGLVQFTKDI
jgi:hypothetical protein